MAKYSRNIALKFQKKLNEDQIVDLQSWLRPLQKALALEVDHCFINLLGREENFNSFMSRELTLPPHVRGDKDINTVAEIDGIKF